LQGEVPANYFDGQHSKLIPENTEEVFEKDDQDEEYFSSYAYNISIHMEMLRDEARTDGYRKGLLANKEAIEGKVVVDVGCGTGILSLFCAELGAKKVYAVEASEMASTTRKIVEANGFSHIIEVIRCDATEIDLGEGVDVIISEWMGTMLLFEAMIDCVIRVRDKWLKRGGKILPAWAAMYTAGVCASDVWEKVTFWDNVYGYDMSMLRDSSREYFFSRPVIGHVLQPSNVVTSVQEVRHFESPRTLLLC
jgi:protein arginine N-methyltransferase 6